MDLPKGISCHGRRLKIRVQHNGRKYIRYTTPSKDPLSKASVAEAIRITDELNARLRLGLAVDDDNDSVAAPSILFEEAAQNYLDQLDVEYSTAKTYKALLERYWLPALSGFLINEIKPMKISATIKRLPISRKTQRNALGPLRGIFDWAIENNYAVTNPCLGIRIRKHQPVDLDPFTEKEKAAILGAIDKLYGSAHQRRIYYTVLFETGLRPSEALALTWPDYDGEYLTICKAIVMGRHKHSTKTHVSRKVYVPAAVRRLLNNHSTRFKHEHIFVNQHGGPYLNNSRLDEHWRNILTTAKVRYRRPYNCRHTYASIGLSSGLEPGFLAAQLGHSLEIFYRNYATWISEARNHLQFQKLDQLSRSAAPHLNVAEGPGSKS